MSSPTNKIAQLTEKLRSRLHGNLEDFKPDFVPSKDGRSSDARSTFDRLVQTSITEHGEKEVEAMLVQLDEKSRDIDREAELRIWEMIFGWDATFKERAQSWNEPEKKIYKRALVVRSVYKKEKARKEGKEEEE